MAIDLDRVSREAFFMNPEMVRFLLVENLALKTLLHEKGIIDPDEYKRHQDQATATFEDKVKRQIEDWKKANPKLVGLLEEKVMKAQSNSADQQTT